MIGKKVTLKSPYLGYADGEVVGRSWYQWIVRLESGKEILLYSDEFEVC